MNLITGISLAQMSGPMAVGRPGGGTAGLDVRAPVDRDDRAAGGDCRRQRAAAAPAAVVRRSVDVPPGRRGRYD